MQYLIYLTSVDLSFTRLRMVIPTSPGLRLFDYPASHRFPCIDSKRKSLDNRLSRLFDRGSRIRTRDIPCPRTGLAPFNASGSPEAL